MTISYPLTLPSAFSCRTFQLGPDHSDVVNESPFSKKQTIYSHTGERWSLSLQWPPLNTTYARQLQAFICALDGAVGTFYFGDPQMATPLGLNVGTPVVNGAGQTGKTLSTTGWTPSTTGVLKAGDYIQLGTYLHIVLQDASSNGSGVAVLDIFPRLRVSPSNGSSVITTGAKGLFRLDPPNQSWGGAIGGNYDFSITAIEAL